MKTRTFIPLLLLVISCISSIAGFAEIKFKKDGHQFTTFLVASLADLDESESYLLTFYSQYPDMDYRYSAVSVSLRYLLVPWKWDWRHDINAQLHSLHGGDAEAIKARRSILKNLITAKLKENSPERFRDAGLMIHALADSYAHTKGELGTPREKAFGKWVGHLFAGDAPDTIANKTTFPKYEQYVRDLFDAFSPDSSADGKRKLDQYIAALRTHVGDAQAMTLEILEQSKNLSRFDQSRFDLMVKDSSLKLQPIEVQSVMDQMKRTITATSVPTILSSHSSDRHGNLAEVVPLPSLGVIGEEQ